MSTLYEIAGDYLRLLEMLEEEESIDPQAFANTLEGIEGEFEIKADNYARIIKELRAESRSMLQKSDGCRKGWRRLRTMKSGSNSICMRA